MEPNDILMKEVYFDQYCKTCKNKNLKENDSPCYECLQEPARVYSCKPDRWEES